MGNLWVGNDNQIATRKSVLYCTDTTDATKHRSADYYDYSGGPDVDHTAVRVNDARANTSSDESKTILSAIETRLTEIYYSMLTSKYLIGSWTTTVGAGSTYITPWIDTFPVYGLSRGYRNLAYVLANLGANPIGAACVHMTNDPAFVRVASRNDTFAIPAGECRAGDYHFAPGNTQWLVDAPFPWQFIRFSAQTTGGTTDVALDLTGLLW